MTVRTVSTEKVIGDLTVKLTSVSKTDAFERLKAALKYIASLPVDPGYGQGGGQPDNSLPGSGARPDQGLPPAGGTKPIDPDAPAPDNSLPGAQPGPDQGLPGRGGQGGRPDNSLPGAQPGPDQGLPGQGGRPDNSLPGAQPGPDQGLPGQGGRPDNSLPGSQPGPDNSLPGGAPAHPWLGENVDEIAKAILKGTACDPEAARPKR